MELFESFFCCAVIFSINPVPGRGPGRGVERRGGGAGMAPLALLCENAVENGNGAVLGGLGAWPVRVVFPKRSL